MKTWVLWTHNECAVYVSLHPSLEAAYRELANSWLDSCDEDECGHVLDTNQEIADALSYHWDSEMDYDIFEADVPELVPQSGAPITPPDNVTISQEKADALLGRLESFRVES
jgi:hypothetical protein